MIAGGPIASAPIAALAQALPTISCQASITLDAVVLSATGTVHGLLYAGAVQLDGVVLAATATVSVEAAVSITLDDVQIFAGSFGPIAATGAIQLEDVTCRAILSAPFHYTRAKTHSGHITRKLGALPTTIITAGSVSRTTRVLQ